MSIFTLSINDPGLDKKSAEMAFIERAVQIAMTEATRGRGTITSGTILGPLATHPTATGPASLGSWTYTPSASKA